jgi:hypothetical protein
LSAKSSLQFDGKHLVLKASIEGATDRFGAPLQTDGIAGTADDYILELDGDRRDYTDILCLAPGCPEAMVVGEGRLQEREKPRSPWISRPSFRPPANSGHRDVVRECRAATEGPAIR